MIGNWEAGWDSEDTTRNLSLCKECWRFNGVEWTATKIYNKLCLSYYIRHSSHCCQLILKINWKIKALFKAVCFTWLVVRQACLTHGKYRQFKLNMFHCHKTCFMWVMSYSIKEAFWDWNCWNVDSTIRKIWKMIPAVIFWIAWNGRNRNVSMDY